MTYQNDHYPQILREVHQSLVDRQKQSFDVSTELLKDFNKKLSIVQSPLGDEQLHITMKKGTPQETSLYASLGERIEEFHQRARRQLHELHELLKKRGNIVKQIDAVQKALDDPAENGYAQQVEKLKREYSDKRREAVDRYEERLQDIITRAKDMENVSQLQCSTFRTTSLHLDSLSVAPSIKGLERRKSLSKSWRTTRND